MRPEENPERLRSLKQKAAPLKSAGWPAVVTAVGRVLSAMPFGRARKALFNLNQKDGFDCPGCAWPDPDHRSSLGEYCENGAKAIAEEATTNVVDPDFFQKHPVAELGTWTDYELGHAGRLTHPMILKPGATHYTPIDWDDAFRLIASELRALESPDEAIFYTSGRTSNEAAFLYQLLARRFGTNNLPDCSNMCHESSGVALSETVGIGKGSVTLDDIYEADVILVAGQNPGTNHPRMLSALEKAKENGSRIVSINPLNEAGLSRFKNPQRAKGMLGVGTRLADVHLQIRINGDVALAKALLIELLRLDQERGGSVLDHQFIREQTTGFEALEQDLKRYNFDELCRDAGVSPVDVRKVAELLSDTQKIICCWAMGLTQHVNAVDNIREYVNVLLIKGAIGIPGGGTCPVRGHSNVQGDRTVGIWEKIPEHLRINLQQSFGFHPPEQTGYDTVHAINAMAEGKASVFVAMGGNFLSATPDTGYTATALRNCRLTVQVSTKLNRSHLVHGDTALILPCIARSEIDMTGGTKQFVTVENSMGRVHKSSGVLPPVSAMQLSEPQIIARMGEATFGNTDRLNWSWLAADYDRIRDAIENNVPGFERYNERVRQDGGFYLPNGARERIFNTPSGKAVISVNDLPVDKREKDEFVMMTVRSHDQFNTTIYGYDDRYRGISGERRVVLMNSDDMVERGFERHQVVDIASHYGGVERIARQFQIVPYDIPRNCVATYFPEANVLIPISEVARGSNTPVSKLVRVRLK